MLAMHLIVRRMKKLSRVGVALLLFVATHAMARVGQVAPELTASTWLNGGPQKLADLRGKVTLVEFWTFGCYNCRNVEPHVKQWQAKYASRGLVVIGVHTPETAYERNLDNVKNYVRDKHIDYPIVIDADSSIWSAYSNDAWPAWYLIDKRGLIRHVHVGEGAYDQTEREIEALLAE